MVCYVRFAIVPQHSKCVLSLLTVSRISKYTRELGDIFNEILGYFCSDWLYGCFLEQVIRMMSTGNHRNCSFFSVHLYFFVLTRRKQTALDKRATPIGIELTSPHGTKRDTSKTRDKFGFFRQKIDLMFGVRARADCAHLYRSSSLSWTRA